MRRSAQRTAQVVLLALDDVHSQSSGGAAQHIHSHRPAGFQRERGMSRAGRLDHGGQFRSDLAVDAGGSSRQVIAGRGCAETGGSKPPMAGNDSRRHVLPHAATGLRTNGGCRATFRQGEALRETRLSIRFTEGEANPSAHHAAGRQKDWCRVEQGSRRNHGGDSSWKAVPTTIERGADAVERAAE